MPYHYDRVLQERIWLSDEETKIINLPEFQRLKNIKQNGFSYVKYPDATNTRFDHSIGTVYWVTKLYQSIYPNKSILLNENNELRVIRIAALVHDIGHGPFSHVFENLLERNSDWFNNQPWTKLRNKYSNEKKPHELLTLDIIENKISKIIDKITCDYIIQILNNQSKLSLLISGDLDADRLDYLTRDSHYSGLPFGFNIKVIFNEILEQNISIEELEPEKYFLCIKSEGLSAFEQFIIARYAHYKYIAYEPTILTANLIFIKSLEKSLEKNINEPGQISKAIYYLFKKTDNEILNLSFKLPRGKIKKDLEVIISDKALKNDFFNIHNNKHITTNIKLVKLDKSIAYYLLKEDNFSIRSAETIFKKDLKTDIIIMPYLPSALSIKTCVDDKDVNKNYNPIFLYDFSPILQGLEQKMYLDCGIIFLHKKNINERNIINTFNSLDRGITDFDILTYSLIDFLSKIYKKYTMDETYFKVKRTRIYEFITQLSSQLHNEGILTEKITTDIYYYSKEIYEFLQKLEYLDIITEDFNIVHSNGLIPTYVYSIGEYAKKTLKLIDLEDDEIKKIEESVNELMPKDKSWWEI